MMLTLFSLVALEVIVMTTYGATSDDKIGIMIILFSVISMDGRLDLLSTKIKLFHATGIYGILES